MGISTSNSSFSDAFGLQTLIQRPSGGHGAGGSEAMFGQVVSGSYKIPFGTTQLVYLNSFASYSGGGLDIVDGLIRAKRISR
jgi:hypothetical protein